MSTSVFSVKKGFAPLIVIIIVLAIGAVSFAFYKFNSKPTQSQQSPTVQSPTLSQVSQYYKSSEECQTKTGKRCDCMLTKPDTAESNPTCEGWGPIQSSSSLNETANWKTFQDNRYLFQFKYPSIWSVEYPKHTNEPLVLKDEQKQDIVSISSFNPAVIGISYCGAYPSDKRCENFSVDDISITIDWNVDGQANAMIGSPKVQFGLSVTLLRVNPNSKVQFRQLVSTFKFTN